MRLWVTGYRSYELSIFNDQDPKQTVIKQAIKNSLQEYLDRGLTWVLTGGQLGVEQWTVQVVHELQADYPELKVAMLLPFADFGNNWRPEKQAQLLTLKEQADFLGEVSRQPYRAPQQLKNWQNFMLQHTEAAVMVYDPEHPGKSKFDYQAAMKYQEKNDYQLETLDMFTLQDTADLMAEEQLLD
ncbi:UPF0398 protein [Ligilactobacillus pabuli]|uniref:UPF0398 protein LPAF129_00750 n=1 Tax=Ligilactobacillus pabuli TaxID=2886039 RepID=A0ABQ5JEG2_9LACO|nr:DUF1273 domain-containing protein [Ligilactobacillus pabuli]GKS80390.1 UPF0398 protein [Ligilactobacillus pabuli]HIW88606.1 DUF1273 domain-containing protein [Candidatus Ligilactobacillus excrementipullorum]